MEKMTDLHTNIGLREILTQSDLYGKYKYENAYARHKPVFIYNSYNDISNNIKKRLAMSGMILVRNYSEKFLCLCSNDDNGNVNGYEVSFNENGYYKFGLWYAPIQVSENYCFTSLKPKESHDMMVDSALLIWNTENYCCCVTKNWLVRDEYGLYSLCVINQINFNDLL